MKKLLFSAYSLDVGGIEKALVDLVNYFVNEEYDVTVVLEKEQGVFLKELDSKVHIIKYTPNANKNIIKRKIINFINRVKFISKYKNKFDFSACFTTYSISSSFVARTASKNCCLWGHADYLTLYENDINKVQQFFIQRKYNKFKNIIFVSKEGKNSFLKVFPEMKNKTFTCNNLINENKILQLSNEKIDIEKDENNVTFINVGRHDEKQKKLTRIIEASKMLKNDNYNFRVLFIGEGQDTENYKNIVKNEGLENNIIFLGKKQNPYPYYKIADCVILTSDYEGYPVVFLESFVLNKPIITTKVSDYEEIESKYGYTTTKDVVDIYIKMKMFIENGYEIKEKFDAQKYNENIIKKLKEICDI